MLIFCHIFLLIADLIHCIENSTALQVGSFRYMNRPSPSVIQFSVPEDHHICLPCQGPDVIWTHQNRKVLVTFPSYLTKEDHHYLLLADGSLCIQQLDDSDSGEYYCNHQLVAELQVLTGRDFTVLAGRTLLLPCRGSTKSKRRWFRQTGQKKEVIFILFKNGTEKPEKNGDRLSYTHEALQIKDLQLQDTGDYLCNSVLLARVTVQEVPSEPTTIPSSISTITESAGIKTDVTETKNNMKNSYKNALLLIAVTSFGIMTVLVVAVCVITTSIKCRRKKIKCKYAANGHEDTEMQLWIPSRAQTDYEVFESPSQQEEMIHYASLGRQNWRERPTSPLPDQNHNSVIYSSVIPGSAAKTTIY